MGCRIACGLPISGRQSRLRRLARKDEGQSMVEMAISLLATLGLSFLVFEFSLMAYTYAVMNNAAREGVRYAIVHGSNNTACSGPGGTDSNGNAVTCGDSGGANVKTKVTTYAAASLHTLPSADVTVNYVDTSSNPPSRVQVTVTYPYVPFFQYPGTAPTMSLTAMGRIVN